MYSWNHTQVIDIYNYLKKEHKINCFSAILARDEGVFKTPEEQKRNIKNYQILTQNIITDTLNGVITNYYDKNSFMGRVLNEKDKIQYENTIKSYVDPKFLSMSSASTFGVVDCDGTVHPCEILDKPLENYQILIMIFKTLEK